MINIENIHFEKVVINAASSEMLGLIFVCTSLESELAVKNKVYNIMFVRILPG